MADDDFVQTTTHWVRVFLDHVSGGFMAGQGVSFLDEVRQVPQLAKLHDQMYMCRCFLAVYQRHDVGMMKAFQNVNLGVKVFLQLFVELVQVDGFDGDVARLLLQSTTIISTRILDHAAPSAHSLSVGFYPGDDDIGRLRVATIQGRMLTEYAAL